MSSALKKSIGDGNVQEWEKKTVHRRWYNFTVLSPTISILSGCLSINNIHFKFASRGRQAAPCSIVAIVFCHLHEPKVWTVNHVDQIVNNGDKLYRISQTRNRLNSDEYMTPVMVYPEFFIDDYKCFICVEPSGVYGNLFSESSSCPDFTDGLERFFKLNIHGVITAQGSSVAVWRDSKYGFFYFDPASCNEKGIRITSKGVACIMRFKCMNDMRELFVNNLNNKFDTPYCIDKVTVINMNLIDRGAIISNQLAINKNSLRSLNTAKMGENDFKCSEKKTRKLITKEPLTISISNYDINTEFETVPFIDQNNFDTGYPYHDMEVNIPSTFRKLTGDRVILHGWTHECSDIYKGKGSQSVANCIMAMGMKKVHPVRTWLRTKLDEILSLGDALYAEVKGMKSTSESINSADFNNTKIIIDGNKYYLDIDLLTIVGTISSKLPFILNIKQGLEEFFLINTDGIIESPSLTNAVWTQDDFFYMFDPRECDAEGIRVIKEKSRVRGKGKKKDLSEVKKEIDGQSCVIRFPSVDALVAQFLKSVGLANKNERYIIRHLTIMDDIAGTRPWYDFQPGEIGKTWALSGNLSNESDEFTDNSRGIQGIAMPVVALIKAMETPPNEWTREIVDDVVREGDDYYNWCIPLEAHDDIELTLRNLRRNLYLKNRRIEIKVQESSVIGDIKATSDAEFLNLSSGIIQFFNTHHFGIVEVKDLSVAIWKFDKEEKVKGKTGKESTKEISYYYYDPNPRSKIGQYDINDGEEAAACVIRALDPVQLAHCIELNISPTATGTDEFFIHSLEVESVSDTMTVEEIQKDKIMPIKPALNAYVEIGDDGAYLNGYFDQSNTMRFKPRTRNKQQAANALVTLAMSKLYNPHFWHRQVVDDILQLGDRITEKNLHNLSGEQHEEHEEIIIEQLRDYLLPNEIEETFNIGVNRVTVAINEVIGTRQVENLPDALREFFADNSMGILRQESVILAIWKEGDIYFTMDPRNRFHEKSGEIDGTATVFWFTSLSSFAALIQQLLIDSAGNIVIEVVQLENDYETRLAENLRPEKTTLTENVWHNLSKINDGTWELVGKVSMDDEQLPLENRNGKSAALAIVSIIFSKVYDPRQWTKEIFDEVVITADKLHSKSVERLGDNTVSPRVNQILTEFFLSNRRLILKIKDCVQTGKINAISSRIPNFKSGLEHFFRDNIAGAITLANELNIAVWTSDGYYYCLIPGILRRDQATTAAPRLVRFAAIELLVNELSAFVKIDDDYEISGVDVIDWNKLPPWRFDPSPAVRLSNLPPLNAYKLFRGHARAILCAGKHQRSDISPESMRSRRSAANCVVALGMSVIKNPVTWTKKTLEDISIVGCDVHCESIKVQPKRQKLKPTDVARIFWIGVNVLTADVKESTVAGQVAISPPEPEMKGKKKGRPKKPPRTPGNRRKQRRESPPPSSPSILLDEGLEIFFKNNRSGILVIGRYMIGIWKDQGLYFIYDPHTGSDQGLAAENGVACVMWFACIDSLYDLIFSNIDRTDEYGSYMIYRTIIRTYIIEPLPSPVAFLPFFDTTGPAISTPWMKKTITVNVETLSEYFHVDNGLSVLLGISHMCSPIFDELNRGFQSTAIAAVAIVIGALHVPSTWTAHLLNSILKYGDILHTDSVRMSRTGARTLSPSELLNVFIVGDLKARIHIHRNTTAGILLVTDLVQALKLFFLNNCAGILHTKSLAVAVMQHYGQFYLFDPRECDKFGNSSYNGAACVAKCDNVMRLALLFVNNCNYKVPCVYTINTVNVLNVQYFSNSRGKSAQHSKE